MCGLQAHSAGAAKAVEIVAEVRPELVAPHLGELLPALSVKEPRTRWMTIRVMRFCAHLDPPRAREAVAHAGRYFAAREGLVIVSSADLFLGDAEQDRVLQFAERWQEAPRAAKRQRAKKILRLR